MSAPPAPKKARRSEARRMEDDSIICDDDETDSPFTLFFVRASDGNPTEQEVNNFNELFEVAKNGGCVPQYIEPEILERTQTSDDFFIFPCFRGPLFRKAQASYLKVYGPPILLECITEQKELPQWEHAVFSSVFAGTKICFTNMDPQQKDDLFEKVGWMSGVAGGTLYQETTHLVAGKADRSEKYKIAVQNSIKLMKKDWIDHLWEKSQSSMGKFSAIDRDAISSYQLRVFEGMTMSISSIDGEDRIKIIQLVEENGGQVAGTMQKNKCTHLITDRTQGQKYKKAEQWKSVKIVQTRWVRRSIDLGRLEDESKFHPKYLTVDHIRSSTPKRDANMTSSGPDVSSIIGPGGRLSASSLNISSAITPIIQNNSLRRSESSFVSIGSTTHVATTMVSSTQRGGRRSDHGTPLARNATTPLIRYPTSQSTSSQNPTNAVNDAIENLRLDGLDDLFENCMFFICGVEESKMDKWVRLLNSTGATRVPKFESATIVVVVSPNQQERAMIRRFQARNDIDIVTVKWVVECVKNRRMVSHEEFQWTETEDSQSHSTPSSATFVRQPSCSGSVRTALTKFSEPPPIQNKGIFASHTYCVHRSINPVEAKRLEELIQDNGGIVDRNPENVEFVVFGNLAATDELMKYDTVVTNFFIRTCVHHRETRLRLTDNPFFIPLPQPQYPIFYNLRFYLHCPSEFFQDQIQKIIEAVGGIVQSFPDSQSFYIMAMRGSVPPEFQERSADLSWIVESVSEGRLLSFANYPYEEGETPLKDFERSDNIWLKSTRERDTTQEMAEPSIDDRYRVVDEPMDTSVRGGKELSPIENPYFPDLRQPYKMNLRHLDGVNEYIDNMESPQRESQDTLTTSRVGSILRKAVVITGRRNGEKENQPATCGERPQSAKIPENRKTISSTPVMVRDVNRSARFMPMDQSFADQNQEHEEINRYYETHPHFLLSVTSLQKEEIVELQNLIGQLGGKIEKSFNRDVTHLISNKLSRSPKVLCAISAGKWCLTPDFVTQSVAAGRWLDEKPFEWTLDKVTNGTEIENRLVSVCAHWREYVASMAITHSVEMENRRNGAFSGWRCIIHLDDKQVHQVAPILEAGGAVVFTITQYIEVSTIERPNMAIAEKKFPWDKQSAAMLKRGRIPLYNFEIIYNHLVEKRDFDRTKLWHSSYCSV